MEASEGNITRLWVGVEATRPFPLTGGAAALPALEVGSGDAATGGGMEVGAGLSWNDPQRGMNAALRGRTLVAHVEEVFREQGLAFSFAWEPTPSNRGPSLSLSHAVGAVAAGGVDALLQPVVLEGLAGPGSNGRQFEAQLAYGFPAANDRLTLTPGLALARIAAPTASSGRWRPTRSRGRADRGKWPWRGNGRNTSPSPQSTPSGSPSPHSSEGQRQRARGSSSKIDASPSPAGSLPPSKILPQFIPMLAHRPEGRDF